MPRRLNADAGLERKMARNAFDAYSTAVMFFFVKVQRSEKSLTEWQASNVIFKQNMACLAKRQRFSCQNSSCLEIKLPE